MEYEYHTLRQCADGTITGYYNLNGDPIERTPQMHPYSYDTFVVFKAKDYNRADCVMDHDRMKMWDSDLYNCASAEVFGTEHPIFSNSNPQDVSRFLSRYLKRAVICTALLENCNRSSGYPYWTFCYRDA